MERVIRVAGDTVGRVVGSIASQASAVLRASADLAPSAEQRTSGLVVPTEWFRWLPISSLRLFLPHGPLAARLSAGQLPPEGDAAVSKV